MKKVFPDPVRNLPEADIPLTGLTAWLSQGPDHQILFMEFEQDVELPEHSHDSQYGVVLRGRIDLTINGEAHTFQKGDNYFIPAGAKHSGKIHAGYADITFFNEKGRYQIRNNTES